MKNYYQILGVSQTASLDEIKSAYRKLARQYHPDVAKTADAEKTFKEINKAYEVLSDSLKRADYDQFLQKETYVKTEKAKEEVVLDRSLIIAAFARVGAYIVTFVAAVFILEWFVWWLGFSETRGFSLGFFLPGIIAGILLGGFWGADANFKVETFLGAGTLGRTYTFLRTICMGISLGYILGLIGSLADQYFYNGINWITLVFFLMGTIIGSTAGSDGDTIEKIYSPQGRFNLFYTSLRGIEVGATTGFIGFLIGLLLVKFGAPAIFLAWGAFFGFLIGDLAGSIAPSNLAAYASYASAYVTSIMVILMVLGALILGIFIGSTLGEELGSMLSSFWQGIVSLF